MEVNQNSTPRNKNWITVDMNGEYMRVAYTDSKGEIQESEPIPKFYWKTASGISVGDEPYQAFCKVRELIGWHGSTQIRFVFGKPGLSGTNFSTSTTKKVILNYLCDRFTFGKEDIGLRLVVPCKVHPWIGSLELPQTDFTDFLFVPAHLGVIDEISTYIRTFRSHLQHICIAYLSHQTVSWTFYKVRNANKIIELTALSTHHNKKQGSMLIARKVWEEIRGKKSPIKHRQTLHDLMISAEAQLGGGAGIKLGVQEAMNLFNFEEAGPFENLEEMGIGKGEKITLFLAGEWPDRSALYNKLNHNPLFKLNSQIFKQAKWSAVRGVHNLNLDHNYQHSRDANNQVQIGSDIVASYGDEPYTHYRF